MVEESDKVYVQHDEVKRGGVPLTRREVLRAAAGVLGTLALPGVARGQDVPATQPTSQSAVGLPIDPGARAVPPWLAGGAERSRVVDIRGQTVLCGNEVAESVLAEMLSKSVEVLTGVKGPHESWSAVLGSATQIAVKFNRVGASTLQTTESMARALVSVLEAAGYERGGITLIEAPDHIVRELGTRKPGASWGASIPVGGDEDELAGYLYDTEALINVPFLKTHQIAGMSGAMKNLSHALIRHPARYHKNGCSPYVGQVVGSQPVRTRLKLNICDALRTVVREGPAADAGNTCPHGGLLVGFDPVAVDAVGLDILRLQRRQLGLGATGEVIYLRSADQLGVGRGQPHGIERVPVVHL